MHLIAIASRATAAAAFLAFTPQLIAQAPGVPIETNHPRTGDETVLERAAKLREAGKLMQVERVKEQSKTPVGGAVELAKPNTEPLPGREVAKRARNAYLQVGWYYLCPRCDHWHLNLAGGYAISKDAIVTCHHCIEPKIEMREGYLITVDHTGSVVPVTAVIGRSQTMDAAILRVDGGDFIPLPLSDQVAQGDAAYCFSEPLGQEGYFSSGIVNRFYWRGTKRGEPGSLDELKSLRVNVSTDWAPGSSGAAVLDACANVIGHVSTISPLSEAGSAPPAAKVKAEGEQPRPQNDRFNGATLITLHEAVPARGITALANAAASSGVVAKPKVNYDDLKISLLDAIKRKKWPEAKMLSDDMEESVPAEERGWFSFARADVAVGTRDGILATSLATKLAEAPDTKADLANDVAWMLVTADKMKNLDLASLEKLARRGVDLAESNDKSAVLDTLARIVFLLGRNEEAIKLQQQSVDNAKDEVLKARLDETLQSYRDGKLPAE